MAWTIEWDTVLIVHSRVARMFNHVCFALPVLAAIAGPMATIGGLEAYALKNEKGLRLTLPSVSTDVTKAMGRGDTPLRSS